MDKEIVPPPSRIEELKKTFNIPDYIWMLCDIDMNKLSDNIKAYQYYHSREITF